MTVSPSPSPAPAAPATPVHDLDRHEGRGLGMTLLGVVRLMLGLVFLWAFLDKLFGLSFTTPPERSVLAGGSPTTGFLTHAVPEGNPFTGVWSFFVGLNPLTDILFMAGLLGIGLALTLGIGMRVATVSGVAMYALMYFAEFPPANIGGATNPLLDDHLINAVLLIAMCLLGADRHVGLGSQWRRAVKGSPFLI